MSGSHAADVERFNRWADTYESFWGRRFFEGMHQATLDLVSSAVEVCPSTILDIGCGTGRLLRHHRPRHSRSGFAPSPRTCNNTGMEEGGRARHRKPQRRCAHHASSAVGHYITGSRQPKKFLGRRNLPPLAYDSPATFSSPWDSAHSSELVSVSTST
jgi:hypothetical protein